jgi:hypothetical protein
LPIKESLSQKLLAKAPSLIIWKFNDKSDLVKLRYKESGFHEFTQSAIKYQVKCPSINFMADLFNIPEPQTLVQLLYRQQPLAQLLLSTL